MGFLMYGAVFMLLMASLRHAAGFTMPIMRLTRPGSVGDKGSRSTRMSSGSLQTNWDFLDGIYLITTEGGDERVLRTRKQLEKVGMWGKVQVRTFKTDDEDRVRGCYTSHMNVLSDVAKTMDGKDDYKILVLEDNLETTTRMSPDTVDKVREFLGRESGKDGFDVFHLAYMMYVPGLFLKDIKEENVRKMYTDASSAVGTSAYIVSKRGVDAMLANNKAVGFTEAVPNVMSRLFPESRYAAYPMVFHRAGKINSLVNPQLDDFRKVMFTPTMYTNWEKLMVGTGLQNNQLFPGLMVTLLFSVLAATVSVLNNGGAMEQLVGDNQNLANFLEVLPQVLVGIPLAVALWGATLFTPGVTGGGYATNAQGEKYDEMGGRVSEN